MWLVCSSFSHSYPIIDCFIICVLAHKARALYVVTAFNLEQA
ncbi:hypothetical protein PTRA_a0791 [Pseudoalteromonas translucida KMM 520]|uniref:Uncharacterized protein n=1 Tax=Pseudoalteromonas translucida KMM 520 TaxID=1315283 RepID=A0A0U2WAJ5_9GAMM|nr:hypothetical protein PTRA_a0791 [Pseudoalteromonas translucida KMM 520]